MEESDVAGVVVAIHNVPGKGDVGAVLVGHLEVANIIVLGSCTTRRKERVIIQRVGMLSSSYVLSTYLSVIQIAALL